MKRAISLLLCFAFLTLNAQDECATNAPSYEIPFTEGGPDQMQPKAGIYVVCFVLVCVICAGVILWKVRGCYPSNTKPEMFVLEKSTDLVNYVPIATNIVTLNGTNWHQLFKELRTDENSWYRVIWVKGGAPRLTP